MHERATVGAAVSAAVVAGQLAKIASAAIAATNKLRHRLSTSQRLTFSTSFLVPFQRFNLQRFTSPKVDVEMFGRNLEIGLSISYPDARGAL